MPTPIKYIHSGMSGAPVLSGTAGANAAVLDAALVNGLGLKAVTSIVISGGIATATVAAPHAFEPFVCALVAGASPPSLNGEKVVTATSSTTVSWATAEADGTATGSISIKVAPLGWAIAHTGTNLRAYKPSAPEASGSLLRLDDTGTTTCRVVAYESMSDINTGIGAAPTPAQVSGGAYWPKSETANATARRWMLCGDAQSFVLWIAPYGPYQTHGVVMGFGDLVSDKSGDAYGCMLTDSLSDAAVTPSPVPGCLGYGHGTSAAAAAYVSRAFTGIGGAQVAKKVAAHNTGAGYAGLATYNGNALPYPNGADNSLRLSPVEVLVGTSGFRGRVAGVYHSPQQLGDSFSTGDKVPGEGVFAGKTFMAVRAGPPAAALANAGTLFIDLTNWRA